MDAVWLAREAVVVRGPDATDYLQGQVSQDVTAVGAGASMWSWVLQPAGKVDAGVLAAVLRERLIHGDYSPIECDVGVYEPVDPADFVERLSAYVYRENMLLTMAGIVFGIAFGTLMHRYIITTMETRLTMFSREIWLSSYVYAILITTGFAMGVNRFTSRKLKQINMVEALKSVD